MNATWPYIRFGLRAGLWLGVVLYVLLLVFGIWKP